MATDNTPDPMQPDTDAIARGLPPAVRIDDLGRRMCKAKRRDGELCRSPAVTGMQVCRMHGGSSPQARNKAKLRLAELADPAIATLAREMTKAEKSSDRLRAANSILDRSGFGRSRKIEGADARELLRLRLLELQAESFEFADDSLDEL